MEAPTLSEGLVTLRPSTEGDPDEIGIGDADGDAAVAVVVVVEGRAAGRVMLLPSGRGSARVGCRLLPWARGRGAMSTAVRLFLRWAFDTPGWGGRHAPLEVVHWQSPVGDWSARRVAWACGFAVEGRVRLLLDGDGGRQDAWVGSLRAGDELRPAHPWLEAPVVEAGDLVLRPHGPGDVDRITQACAHPSTMAWLPALPFPYREADARAFVAGCEEQRSRADGLDWAVAERGTGVLLGSVGVHDLAAGTSTSGEVGYWTHPDARGRGVMTAAVRAVSRHCLLPAVDGGIGLDRLLLRAAEPNAASRRVAEKAGFTPAGRDRRAERLTDGRVVDLLRHDLLADELDARWAPW